MLGSGSGHIFSDPGSRRREEAFEPLSHWREDLGRKIPDDGSSPWENRRSLLYLIAPLKGVLMGLFVCFSPLPFLAKFKQCRQ